MAGRPLRRTWSLLAKPAAVGSTSLSLLHDPQAMGWRIGDRIMVAPTTRASSGTAEAFTIGAFGIGNVVELASADGQFGGVTAQTFAAEARASGSGGGVALLSAEVINLRRSVVITGDDFSQVPCSSFSTTATTCTMGLHTAMMARGGLLRMQHARVERCGQRGVLGKYCIHLHLIAACPACVVRGNAVERSMQRGLIIHGTHQSLVEANVFADVRGANLYIEDGNEMYNRVLHNVAICPWAREGAKRGCTVPGTDNGEADTALNQAGLWSLPSINHVVGNRFANHFNGMFFMANFAGGAGRGAAQGLLCTEAQLLGRIQGNTMHGHGRFGTYLLGPNFPRATDQSLENNGRTDRATCGGFDAAGGDRGVSTLLDENVDYGNVFVGQYDAGDIQYREHSAYDSNNLLYWKTTKNFADGCSAHLLGGEWAGGNVALPDQAAFLIEGASVYGDTALEANHHCDVGVTGVLCMPTYVLVGVDWRSTAGRWMWFPAQGTGMKGGIFTLAPPEEANPSGAVFPIGYCALVSSSWDYLLAIGGGAACATAESLGVGGRYDGGILCKRRLRSLRIYSRGLTDATASPLRVEVYEGAALKATQIVPYHQIGDDPGTKKQGYALPVATGRDITYRLRLDDGTAAGELDPLWVIEFSDPVLGNRWGRDEITLAVAGRACATGGAVGSAGVVHSHHDRRFVWTGVWDGDHLPEEAGAAARAPRTPTCRRSTAPPPRRSRCRRATAAATTRRPPSRRRRAAALTAARPPPPRRRSPRESRRVRVRPAVDGPALRPGPVRGAREPVRRRPRSLRRRRRLLVHL